VGLPERDGLLVRAVEDDGPAGRAGVEPGDLIVAVDRRPVDGVDALYDVLDLAPEQLALTLVRGEQERDVEVALR
jgi:S1-C subfamily serine protease